VDQMLQKGKGEFDTWVKGCFPPSQSEFIPRTDRKAVIASIDSVADQFTQFAWNMALVLNRKIRNATCWIDLVRAGERARWTNIQTSCAASTCIRRRLIRR